MFLTFATMQVIITEVINTAIEEAINLNTKQFHPIAKMVRVKF